MTRKTTVLLLSLCLVAGLGAASIAGADNPTSTGVVVTEDVSQDDCGLQDPACADGGSGGGGDDGGGGGECGKQDPACIY